MSDEFHAPTFEAPAVEEVSRLFPAYDVQSIIACGGMGAVYYATQLSLDRVVAIKILPREFSQDQTFRDNFESEAKAMAKLNHPNLIGVYDFGEMDGMFFIVMEYVPGQSLYHHSHGHALDKAEAVRLIIDICSGLAHAHEFGILHRDIKPSNILLDAHMNPKVGDFGLAQAMGKSVEDGEQIYGTPGYTAPEVIEPPHTFDQRADVFSIGIMLQELLTGRPPNPEKLIDEAFAISNPRISSVIRQAIDPDPKYRTKSVNEFVEALQKAAPPTKTNTQAAVARQPRPAQSPFGKARFGTQVAGRVVTTQGDSSGFTMVLVLFAVVAAVAVFIVLGNKKNDVSSVPKDKDIPKSPTNEVTTVPVNEPKDAPNQLDASTAIKNAKAATKRRFSSDIESYKRDMRVSVQKFTAELEHIAPAMKELIDRNVESWKANEYRIPAALPQEIRNYSGADTLHERYLNEQKSFEENLEERVALQSGLYILELETQIELMTKVGNENETDAVEAEIRNVKENSGYFRSLMLD